MNSGAPDFDETMGYAQDIADEMHAERMTLEAATRLGAATMRAKAEARWASSLRDGPVVPAPDGRSELRRGEEMSNDLATMGLEALRLAIKLAVQEGKGVTLSWETAKGIARGYELALARYTPPTKHMAMICGVDCRPGDGVCSGYCHGASDSPPPGPDAQSSPRPASAETALPSASPRPSGTTENEET